ncbi:site-specific integrase [Microvirga sp. Mcv34]|uniref:site-specific integrase n=1 Tax=Microvirga sp. Mcv34 TaxID=2926016 RepID=UPI0021C88367|nr:site-specific integrase [Microvirga sp. Mcv34]
MKLNQRTVASIKPGPRLIVWDDSLPGFGVRVTEGSVSYIVDFRISGRRRRVALGSTTLLKFDAARDRAGEIIVAGRKGVDLTLDERRGMPTFKEVWEEMIALDRLQRAPATIEDYEDRANRLILPDLGKKLICDVTPAHVEKVVASATGERNKAYIVALIKKTFNFARDKKHYLPETHRNPTGGMKVRAKAATTARALEADDIAKFGIALAEMEGSGEVSPWLANLFRLSLICGLRPGEVRTLTWAKVNLPKRKLTVVGKTGEREIHLTDAAVQVLEATPRVQGCEYVFAGRRYGQPIAAVHKVLRKVQEKAEVERFRPYDLRHSAATGALASGADLAAVRALLGHSDLRTTQGYLHASEKRQRIAAERAAAFGRRVLGDG